MVVLLVLIARSFASASSVLVLAMIDSIKSELHYLPQCYHLPSTAKVLEFEHKINLLQVIRWSAKVLQM